MTKRRTQDGHLGEELFIHAPLPDRAALQASENHVLFGGEAINSKQSKWRFHKVTYDGENDVKRSKRQITLKIYSADCAL